MKLNRLIPMALTAIAVAGLGTAPVSGQAVSGNGELLLGFRATGGAGSTKNYVVDLGPVATFLSASAATTIPLSGVSTDLSDSAFYGSDWHDRTDLFWGVVGANGNFAAIGSETPGTLYATRVNLGGITPAWARHYGGSQSSSTTVVESARSGFNFGTAATSASAIARTMTSSDANSWSSFQPTASLISFNTWDPTIEGTPSQYLDLFKIVPLASGNPEGPSAFVGRMALLSSGDLLFVPAAALGVNSIEFAAATYSAAEDNSGGVLTVTLNRSGDITGPSSVTVTTADVSAVAGTDYTALSAFAVNFLAGETTKTVDISVANRTGDQGTRSFTVTLGGATGGTSIGAQGSTTASITEAISTLQFSALEYSAEQSDSVATVTITRTGGSSAVTVQLSTADGSAAAGTDYTALTNQVVTIPSNTDSVDATITLTSPTGATNKDFFVNLSTPGSGAELNADPDTLTSTVTILAPDSVAPTIAISSPADKAVIAGTLAGSITVTGNASDAVELTKVEVSIDGGTTWTLASGTTSWTASVQPAGGLTTILAVATDRRGNSTTATRAFTYKITGSLTVNVVDVGGAGSTVTGALAGSAAYEVGKSYTLTAKPGVGRAFDHWSVPGSTGASVFTFVYTQALVNGTVTATFVANPFLPASNVAGTYTGLITADLGTEASNSTNGCLSVSVLTGTGAFTGKVKIDGASLTIIKGVFDNNGAAKFDVARSSTANIIRVNKAPYVLSMNLSLTGTHQITGTLKEAGRAGFAAESSFTADQAVTTAPALVTNLGAKGGCFTAVMPARDAASASLPGLSLTNSEFPQGDSFCSIKVSPKGLVTFATVLADGTAFTASSPLGTTNKAVLFGQLYTLKAGSFGGEVTFAESSGIKTVTSSDMFWFRPYIAGQHYPYGWPEGLLTDLTGTEYSVPVGASVVPDLGAVNATTGNAELIASDGLMNTSITKSFNISTLNKVTTLGTPADKSFGIVIASATGVIGGAPSTFFTHSDNTKTAFKAIIVRKGPAAGCYGFFLTNKPKTIDGLGESGGISISAK